MSEKALQPIEQRQVEFYGDELTAVRFDDNSIYVSVRHLCDALGLDRASQVRRIKRTDVLNEGYKGGVKVTSPGGTQTAGMLLVDLVPMWLAGVQVKNVREELQERLRQYQREAARVLWEAFQEGRLTAEPTFDELLANDSDPNVQVYKMARAMMQMAKEQILIRGQLQDHEQRLEQIEAQLGDVGRHITPDQASQISQAVKTVALAYGKKTKRNEFGAVYGELYRKFGITSYKELPAAKFDAAMAFLTEWHQNLVGSEPF